MGLCDTRSTSWSGAGGGRCVGLRQGDCWEPRYPGSWYACDAMSFYLDARATRSARLVQENEDMAKRPIIRGLDTEVTIKKRERHSLQYMESRTKGGKGLSLFQPRSMEYPGRTRKGRRNCDWSLNNLELAEVC